MKRVARFETFARTDGSRPERCTVTIDRNVDLLMVRPYRRRRVYAMPLSLVASIVAQRVLLAEAREKREARRNRRRTRAA
jgi:hypothetical protein